MDDPHEAGNPAASLDEGRSRQSAEASAAVLIPAHNEEAVIGATLESVLREYSPEDVFVFDDASTDATASIARRFLADGNVIEYGAAEQTENIGKSRGLEYALTHRIYPRGYEYVTILDADTTLAPDYRHHAVGALASDERLAGAAGQVKSRPYGMNLISLYRAYIYFLWQALFKRVQSAVGAISIAPGCATTWRTTALRQIEFNHGLSTEDFHLTMAAHRQSLGRIRYVHPAVVWTQDPLTLRAFMRQTWRWSRAWWEAVRLHRVGLRWIRRDAGGGWRLSGLDIFSAVLVAVLVSFFLRLFALPFFLLAPLDPPALLFPETELGLALDLAAQLAIMLTAVVVAAIGTGRPLMVPVAVLLIVLVLLDFLISMAALVSVLRRQYPRRPASRAGSATWVSPERRRIGVASAAGGAEQAAGGGS